MKSAILVGTALAGALFATSAMAASDLSVTVTDSPDPVTAGDNLTYLITLTNSGPDTASSVTMSLPLPVGTTFLSLSTSGLWNCTTPAVGATGTVTCTSPAVAVGVEVFTLVSNVDVALAGGTVLSLTASAASADVDPNPGNESDTETTTVVAAPPPPPPVIPTLTEWAMILLGAGLAALGGAFALRRRHAV